VRILQTALVITASHWFQVMSVDAEIFQNNIHQLRKQDVVSHALQHILKEKCLRTGSYPFDSQKLLLGFMIKDEVEENKNLDGTQEGWGRHRIAKEKLLYKLLQSENGFKARIFQAIYLLALLMKHSTANSRKECVPVDPNRRVKEKELMLLLGAE